MTENEQLAAHINGALEGAKDEADAIIRLRAIGCSERTASLYAAHHFGTHRSDVTDHAKKEK